MPSSCKSGSHALQQRTNRPVGDPQLDVTSSCSQLLQNLLDPCTHGHNQLSAKTLGVLAKVNSFQNSCDTDDWCCASWPTNWPALRKTKGTQKLRKFSRKPEWKARVVLRMEKRQSMPINLHQNSPSREDRGMEAAWPRHPALHLQCPRPLNHPGALDISLTPETERDRQRERQRERETEAEAEAEAEAERPRDRETERPRGRETERPRDRETERPRDRETERLIPNQRIVEISHCPRKPTTTCCGCNPQSMHTLVVHRNQINRIS